MLDKISTAKFTTVPSKFSLVGVENSLQGKNHKMKDKKQFWVYEYVKF